MSYPPAWTVAECVEAIRSSPSPLVVWLGSAASLAPPSALPTVGPILRGLVLALTETSPETSSQHAVLLKRAARDLGDGGRLDLAAPGRIQFEAAVGEVRLHTFGFIPALLGRLFPARGAGTFNPVHESAAMLAGRAGTLLVTTNFDECIEAAADARALPLEVRSGADALRPALGLLKLHGTISDPDSLAADPEGLRRRASSAEWRSSLRDALNGRVVLLVGYSISDSFDITPVLREAVGHGGCTVIATVAAGHGASGGRPRPFPIPVRAVVPADLRDPSGNALVAIARELAGMRRVGPVRPAEPLGAAQIAVIAAEELARAGIGVGRRLEALGALYYWLEQGSRALAMFEAAASTSSSGVDGHALARAYLRARRYRAAVREFDRLLAAGASGRRADTLQDVLREVDLHIGAAHCASAGGMRRASAAHHRQAIEALSRSGIATSDLDPYLADQVLRSRAGWELAAAQRSRSVADRDRRLARAEALLDQLSRQTGLALTTALLLDLDRARIALARGDASAARRLADGVRASLGPWGDPHGVTVARRIGAVAARDRLGLVRIAAGAARRGQWLEASKAGADAVVAGWPGASGPMTHRLRDALVSGWDLGKDVATCARTRLGGCTEWHLLPRRRRRLG